MGINEFLKKFDFNSALLRINIKFNILSWLKKEKNM